MPTRAPCRGAGSSRIILKSGKDQEPVGKALSRQSGILVRVTLPSRAVIVVSSILLIKEFENSCDMVFDATWCLSRQTVARHTVDLLFVLGIAQEKSPDFFKCPAALLKAD